MAIGRPTVGREGVIADVLRRGERDAHMGRYRGDLAAQKRRAWLFAEVTTSDGSVVRVGVIADCSSAAYVVSNAVRCVPTEAPV
jgi:hypothetical protein